MKDTSARIKIGVVVLVSAALFILMIMAITQVSFKPQHDVRVYFSFINSLEVRAPVRFAGARVGEVKQIHILSREERRDFPKDPPYVCVVASVDRSVGIPKQTKAMVNTMGFMGEKYLELIPESNKTIDYLADNDTLTGIDPTPMDSVFASAKKLADELEVTIKNVNTMTDQMQTRIPVLIGELEKTMTVAQDLAGNAKSLSQDAQSMLRTNRENLDHLIANSRQITIFMKSFSHVMATRPWKLIWGLGGPMPIESESEKFLPSVPPMTNSNNDSKTDADKDKSTSPPAPLRVDPDKGGKPKKQ